LGSAEVRSEPPFGHWVRKRAKGRRGREQAALPAKKGQIEIEDVIIVTKSESGAVALTQLSNASSFWEVRAAASGYPAPPAAGFLTDYGGDEKFVREIAEAIPSGRAAVFVLVGKRPKEGPFDGSTTGEGAAFFGSYNKSAAPTVRAAFFKVEGQWTRIDCALTTVKEVSFLKRTFTVSCSIENYCNK
jgi:uncharacterized membrane protein